MFNIPSVNPVSFNVPNVFRASPRDMDFLREAARDEAPNIQAMLPDALSVVKTAGAILGLLAIGCTVAMASRREDTSGNS
jgi:hypothetical protein